MDLLDGTCYSSTSRVLYKPDKEKCIKCYTDADFAGGWDQVDSDKA